jgi:hypothetical protein
MENNIGCGKVRAALALSDTMRTIYIITYIFRAMFKKK